MNAMGLNKHAYLNKSDKVIAVMRLTVPKLNSFPNGTTRKIF